MMNDNLFYIPVTQVAKGFFVFCHPKRTKVLYSLTRQAVCLVSVRAFQEARQPVYSEPNKYVAFLPNPRL